MVLLRFLISALYSALLTPIYLLWAQQQADAQIDKMQEAAFNTPGAESAVTPAMALGGAGVLASQLFVGRALLRLSGVQSIASLLLGSSVGAIIFWKQLRGPL